MSAPDEKSPTPPPTRSLRQAPTPRTFYNPGTTQKSANFPQKSATSPEGASPPKIGPTNYPLHPRTDANPPSAQPAITPRNTSGGSSIQKRLTSEIGGVQEMMRVGTGHPGASDMKRMVMGIRSGIASEVDYALSELVPTSFSLADELLAERYPGLSEALFGQLSSIEGLIRKFINLSNPHRDVLEILDHSINLDKLNEAALVLRNMSIMDSNAKYFAELEGARDVLVRILDLPSYHNLFEAKNHCLDTLESMASHIDPEHSAELHKTLRMNLHSGDRALIITSLKTICRLSMGRDHSNQLGQIPKETITDIGRILLLDFDEELVSAGLDFLYQFTANSENVNKLLGSPEGDKMVDQLIRLLLHGAVFSEKLMFFASKKNPKVNKQPRVFPELPMEVVEKLLEFPEPTRAAKWMQCCFEEAPNEEVTQVALWQAYQGRFSEFVVSHNCPLLPAADFIKNINMAFAEANAMVISLPTGTQKFIIKGIKPRANAVGVEGHEYTQCNWHSGQPRTQCNFNAASSAVLWRHILNKHCPFLLSPKDRTPFICCWGNCERFPSPGTEDAKVALSHLSIHIPDPKNGRRRTESPDDATEHEFPLILERHETNLDEKGEAVGIPLTSVLVLKNIAKHGDARGAFEPFKEYLCQVMIVNDSLNPYISDLCQLVWGSG